MHIVCFIYFLKKIKSAIAGKVNKLTPPLAPTNNLMNLLPIIINFKSMIGTSLTDCQCFQLRMKFKTLAIKTMIIFSRFTGTYPFDVVFDEDGNVTRRPRRGIKSYLPTITASVLAIAIHSGCSVSLQPNKNLKLHR